MSRTITISLYSTVKSAPLSTSLTLSRYPLVRNFRDFSTRRGVSRKPSREGSSPMSASKRRTESCIWAFYLFAVIVCSPGLHAAPQASGGTGSLAQADELYRHREDPASAKQAAELYEKQSAQSFEAAWKSARADYWLATNGPDKDRKTWRERGVKSAELAIKLDPSKPEGHFWLAANLGEVAENASFLTAWKYPGRIKDELEMVLKMDPAWQ